MIITGVVMNLRDDGGVLGRARDGGGEGRN